jgi:hypothetical protein
MSADVIGLHDRAAERLARREFPRLADAKAHLEGHTREEILAIARRVFEGGGATAEEDLLVCAFNRVQLAGENERC